MTTTRYKAGPRIGVVGDSVARIGVTSPAQRWPNLVCAAFVASGYRPALWNWGVSGQASGYFGDTYRIDLNQVNLNAVQPDILIIELGTNDCQALIATATMQANLANIVADAKLANPNVKLIMLNCTYKFSDATYQTNAPASYNPAIAASATAAGAILVDLYNVYAVYKGSALVDGDLATYTFDGIHPNILGHTLIAVAVQTAIASVGLVSAKYGRIRASQPLYGAFSSLSGLAAIWDMENHSPLHDVSGNYRNLIKHGSPAFPKSVNGGSYVDKLVGDYWENFDAPWNSITGELFIAGMVKHDASAAAVEVYLAKWTTTGNQRCFNLQRGASGLLVLTVSIDGTLANVSAMASSGTIGTGWTFIAARYIPSTSMSTWINATKTHGVTAIKASIFDGSGDIELGAWNAGSNGMIGNIGLLGLYNVAPSDAQVTNLFNQLQGYY